MRLHSKTLPLGVVFVALLTSVLTFSQTKQTTKSLGIDLSNMDRSVRPQDDFFRFVNGAWVDRTTIPADMASYGSFPILREKSDTEVRGIIEAAAAQHNAAKGSETQKVGDLYNSFMDTGHIESLGLTPLKGELSRIDDINKPADLAAAFARMSKLGVRTLPFAIGVTQDPKKSDTYAVTIAQGGLGMPDRDYYLRKDDKFAAIRKSYTAYIASLFTLAKEPDPQGAAQRIVDLETRLAEKEWDRAHSRDRDATYNKRTMAELKSLGPNMDWTASLTTLGGKDVKEVIVRQPDYVTAADAIVQSTPVQTWKEYLTFGLINEYADELPQAFVDAHFNFAGRTVAGQQEQKARWKRGVSEVDGALGEAVGKLYVDKYFTPEAKQSADMLVKNLLAAFKVGIDGLEWMTPATKAQAQAKLAKYTVKIGYPDHWRDYSALEIKAGDLVGDVMRANEFQHDDSWSHLGKPVDRTRWTMTPQTVNAYYNSTNNEIVFPAAILQPPFFNVAADDAVNYGAIGAVIGHEISHGFDDQGRKSDGDGNLRDWWTPQDAKAFEQRATMLGSEYESYDPLPGLKINGRQTMGENIGDLSGLAVAYRAYHISLHGAEPPVIDGYTGDQRFFMGFAQIWRFKARDESLRNQLLTDAHSPGLYRSFVPLTNLDPFYKAFNVQPGDKLYRKPEDRVRIW
jgi:predicted metalloendopeptidase